MPLEPTTVPQATGPQPPPAYVPPVTPPAAPPPSGRRARLRARRAGARNAAFGSGVGVDVAPGARLELGDGSAIGAGTRLLVRAGTVRIGAGAVLGERCTIAAHAGIEIGDGAVLGDEAVIVDFDHRYDDPEYPSASRGSQATPVVIGARCRGSARARRFSAASRIGERAQVAAQSVVTRDVAPGARVGGVPAQPAISRSAGPEREVDLGPARGR